jgi:hypothetical protein
MILDPLSWLRCQSCPLVSEDVRRPDVAESSNVCERRIQVGRLKIRYTKNAQSLLRTQNVGADLNLYKMNEVVSQGTRRRQESPLMHDGPRDVAASFWDR